MQNQPDHQPRPNIQSALPFIPPVGAAQPLPGETRGPTAPDTPAKGPPANTQTPAEQRPAHPPVQPPCQPISVPIVALPGLHPKCKPRARKRLHRRKYVLRRARGSSPDGEPDSKDGLLLNVRTMLEGNLEKGTAKRLYIDGKWPLFLTTRQFLILLVLFCHALARNNRRPPFQVPTGPFLSTKEIIKAIDSIKALEKPKLEAFDTATYIDVSKVIGIIRQGLYRHRTDPNLIETGPYGTNGYRLSNAGKTALKYLRA